MNRQQFAEVAAAAYVNQFSSAGSPVMGTPIIVWNGEQFSSQSELTPVFDGEVVAMYVNDGMFGDVDADASDAQASIVSFLTDAANDAGWSDVMATIEQAQADAEAWSNSSR